MLLRLPWSVARRDLRRATFSIRSRLPRCNIRPPRVTTTQRSMCQPAALATSMKRLTWWEMCGSISSRQ